ncbi:hypothetical protein NMS73_003558, partial [Vibrio cholerae]|nr:hypothetical protein [Vibrio cholerae]
LRFVYDLSKMLVKHNLRIVSGFGVGIGSTVISSVLEETFNNKLAKIEDHLVLRPFPQSTEGEQPLSSLWTKYREDMINYAGIALFLFGNKQAGNDIILSNGMREEYEIAKKQGLLLLPIGSTGYMAEELWTELNSEIQKRTDLSLRMKELYKKLGTEKFNANNVIDIIMEIISLRDEEQ